MRKFIGWLLLPVILFGSVSLLINSQMSTYAALNSGVKVAQICAISTKKPHEMDITLILFDRTGNATRHDYAVQGDTLLLKGAIIRPFTNILIVHSGYKLIALEGHYQNPTLEKTYKPDLILLNGGQDNFFTAVQEHPTPVIQATFDPPLRIPVDGHNYDVSVLQNALISPAPNGPPCNPLI